jgi:hypothetical protein
MKVQSLLSQGRRLPGLRPAALMAEMQLGWARDWRARGNREAMRECAKAAASELRLLRTALTVCGPADGRELHAHYERMRAASAH